MPITANPFNHAGLGGLLMMEWIIRSYFGEGGMITDRACRAVSFLSRLHFAAPTGHKARQALAHRAYWLPGQRT
ncbi:transposase orfB protein [Cupriavidus basilensis OR16]|uniref:Transposase orfB protein n=1 Tax=Cupriavidus basilensis OR16 TaxID=1127483 RepID=H1RZT3_9BURK|nr:transposase orfB protein [Cupriavidus basilensis OR16]